MIVIGSLQLKSPRTFTLIAAAGFALIAPASPQEKPAAPAASTLSAAAINPSGSANAASPAAFAYDVVSIKPYKPEGGRISMGTWPSPNGFTSQATTLMSLLFEAYPILTLEQIVGLPQGSNRDFYNIEAKMGEETAAALKRLPEDQQKEIRRSMLQQVLADRFSLKIHKETREQPVYNLVIAKGGPKFKESPAGKDDYNMGFAEISGDGITIDSILLDLSGESRRVVVDKTGLTGKYSISLKWNPFADQDVPASLMDQYPDFKGRPGLLIALEQQLGLKLEPAKGPVDVYVIDHFEQPSPN